MIDEKKIGKTASFFAKETWNHEEEQFACMDGFRVGVGWAQQEFVKSLWHDASEEPEKNKNIIYYDGRTAYFYHWLPSMAPMQDEDYVPDTWKEFVIKNKLKKWCYPYDILPKEGGEG